MVSKNKTREKKGKIKVGKLMVDKESVKNLTGSEEKQIRGGVNAHEMKKALIGNFPR